MYREDIVLKHVGGKEVLDCGGVDHDAFESKQRQGDWLHELISAKARRCLGVDILEENVTKINKAGRFHFVAANIEELPFESEFDVVVAGEVIEHVYNPGRFLDSAWKALRPDGRLIITTPNATALTAMLYAVFARRELCHPEHTCYFSPQTLGYSVSRHGFSVEELHVVPRKSRLAPVSWLRRLISRANPLLGDQVVLVARKRERQDKYSGKW